MDKLNILLFYRQPMVAETILNAHSFILKSLSYCKLNHLFHLDKYTHKIIFQYLFKVKD